MFRSQETLARGALMARDYQFGFKRLDVYRAAVEHFEWTCEVVTRMPKGPFRVTDQAVGASLSVMGNIGEAHGRESRAGEIEQHYRYAQGSTFECATHLDALSALGVISDEEYNAAEARLARIAMMLTRLIQKQRRRGRELKRIARTPSAAGGRAGKPATAWNVKEPGAEVPNPREARPGARSAARFESRGVARGAQRPPAIESPRSGVSEAAAAAAEIEHRT